MKTLLQTGGLGLVFLSLALPASAQHLAPPDSDAPGSPVVRSAAPVAADRPGQDQDIPGDGVHPQPATSDRTTGPTPPVDTDVTSTAVATPQPEVREEWLDDGRETHVRAGAPAVPVRIRGEAVERTVPSDGRHASAQPGIARFTAAPAADVSTLDDGRGTEDGATASAWDEFQAELNGTVQAESASAGVAPSGLALTANYPNPFDTRTTISFVVPTAGHARLTLFDVRGRQVAVLFDGAVQADQPHRVEVSAEALAVGVYVYTLDHGGQRISRRLQVAR